MHLVIFWNIVGVAGMLDKITGWYAYCENAIHASIDAFRGM